MGHLRLWIGRLFLIGLGMVLASLLLEGVLRLHTVFSAPSAPNAEPVLPDMRLGHRPNPAILGHDPRGWRNTSALARADVVAVGDSQTYGINAAPDEAWPQRLGFHARLSAYQMAYGGYAPPYYVPLLDEVLTLRPKVIVAAYYFGNDMYEAYWFVHRVSLSGKYHRSAFDPILDALATRDPRTRAAIADAENSDPKDLRVSYLECSRPALMDADPDKLLHGPITSARADPNVERAETEKQTSASAAGPRHTVSRFSYRSLLFRSVWPRLRPYLTFALGEVPVWRGAPLLEDYGSPLCVHYRDGPMRTVFQVAYRFVVLDDSDPRVIEGERISLRALRHLASQSKRAGIRFYVLLVPTKETAFRARASMSPRKESLLVKLWQAEARARSRAVAFLAREEIAVIDARHALEALITSGVNPYPEGSDGHPVARGYDAIARAVAARLERDGVWSR